MMKDELLRSLVCPLCLGTLEFDKEKNELICRQDQLIYPIKKNIPVLLAEEAKPLNQETSS